MPSELKTMSTCSGKWGRSKLSVRWIARKRRLQVPSAPRAPTAGYLNVRHVMKSLSWSALLLLFSADAFARGGSGGNGGLAVVGTIFIIALVVAELWRRK